MPKYRKKPVEIEAFQLNTDGKTDFPEWFQKLLISGEAQIQSGYSDEGTGCFQVEIEDMRAGLGDYIVKLSDGSIEVWCPVYMKQTYELLEE